MTLGTAFGKIKTLTDEVADPRVQHVITAFLRKGNRCTRSLCTLDVVYRDVYYGKYLK